MNRKSCKNLCLLVAFCSGASAWSDATLVKAFPKDFVGSWQEVKSGSKAGYQIPDDCGDGSYSMTFKVAGSEVEVMYAHTNEAEQFKGESVKSDASSTVLIARDRQGMKLRVAIAQEDKAKKVLALSVCTADEKNECIKSSLSPTKFLAMASGPVFDALPHEDGQCSDAN